MIANILAPLDGSAIAAGVLRHLPAIVEDSGSSITLLRVLETDDDVSTPVDPLGWSLAKAEAQANLDEAALQLAQHGVSSNTVLLEGAAAQRIIEYVQMHDVGLLVLSSHGKSGLSGWKVSGTALKIIHGVGTSILLVRPHEEGAEEGEGAESESIRYGRMLLPLDGSQRAEAALPLASALAERYSAELLVVHVAAPPEMIQRVPLSPEDKALAERVVARNMMEADKYFAQLQSRLPAGAQTRIILSDSVAQALHELVETEQVDLVVLSAHGHSYHTELPYSPLVESIITYGSTSLLILQDLPSGESRRSLFESVVEEATMPTRSGPDDEGLVTRGQFDV